MKPTDPSDGIANRYFKFEKKFAYIVPDDFCVGDRFDILERDGKKVEKEDKLDEKRAESILSDNRENEIIKNFHSIDPSYNDIKLLIAAERKRKRRSSLLNYLMLLPQEEPKKVIVYKKGNIWLNELQSIRGVSQKDALNIISVYPDKNTMLNDLKVGKDFPFERELEDAIKREFGLLKERKVIPPEKRERMRLDNLKKEEKAPTKSGATTSEHFKGLGGK